MRSLAFALMFSLAISAHAFANEPTLDPEAANSGLEDSMAAPKLIVDPDVQSAKAEESPVLGTMKEPETFPALAESADAKKIPESEIPVLTDTKNAKKNDGSSLNRMLITLGVFALALCGLLFGLRRWTSKRGNKKASPSIKVLSQHSFGSKKSLALVQVAGESMLIGITDQNITMLKSLALIDGEVPETLPNNFDSAMVEYDEPERLAPAPRKQLPPPVERNDFALQGLGDIRDKVSTRLRNMKSF